jgi:hypothetical protein
MKRHFITEGLLLTLAFITSRPIVADSMSDLDSLTRLRKELDARSEARIKSMEMEGRYTQRFLEPPIRIQPTYRGTTVPDYSQPGYILQPNIGGGATLYRTYPGTDVPDPSAPGYSINR